MMFPKCLDRPASSMLSEAGGQAPGDLSTKTLHSHDFLELSSLAFLLKSSPQFFQFLPRYFWLDVIKRPFATSMMEIF